MTCPERKHLYAVLSLALAVILSSSGVIQARTMHLSPSGDDKAQPAHGAVFRSLAVAVNHLWGGDTLIIRNGFYEGGVSIRRGCKPEAPLVIKGESRHAIITGSGSREDAISLNDCQNVILDGVNVTRARRAGILLGHCRFVTVRNCVSYNNGKWGIFTDHSSNFLLENNECFGSQVEHGIYHSNSGDDFVMRGNWLHHNSGCGIHINGDPEYGGDGVISRGIIERNLCQANGLTLGGAGINMTHVQDVIVRNNILLDNLAGGITFYQDTGTFEQGSKRALITGNTVVFPAGQGRSCVKILPTSEKALVCNNIFVSGGRRGCIEVYSEHLPTVLSDNNVLWGVSADSMLDMDEMPEKYGAARLSLDFWRKQTSNDTNSKVLDPQFVSRAYGNLHLSKGSPAAGAGMSMAEIRKRLAGLGGFDWALEQLGKMPDEDFDGKPRKSGKARSAGAFEAAE